ncbi:hypothetical protein [Variovorax sp. E3]|jgi:hypothetical protein|uniref:hypothetical protein n=1 Tax=Variovorax sp. E3 TaxID=1914993 RepID=UPI0018DC177B|nr:hypothetical protein [Variovorax sp. E3]
MKNLYVLAIWALILSFFLSFFYWSDAPLAEQILFGALMTIAMGAWMLVLLNLPRAVIAARNWLKAPKNDSGEPLAAARPRKTVAR